MLESFLVRNFRTFKELVVERLGRVNLIVGKNAVGKTTLLEALWLHAARLRPDAIHQVLAQREEFLGEQGSESRDIEVDIQALFHGRTIIPGPENSIVLGPVNDPDEQLQLRATWVERQLTSETGPTSFVEIGEEEFPSAEGEVLPALAVQYHGEQIYHVRRSGSWLRSLRGLGARRLEPLPPMLRAGSAEGEIAGKWWDAVALEEPADRIVSFMRLLVPIERVTLIESPRPYRTRIFVVRLKDHEFRQPLKSLGDGVERMFRTLLALEYAKRSIEESQRELFPDQDTWQSLTRRVLFIDEIEAGIHYSVIHDYWRMIFTLAREMDVQVFATTHSWDCIEGFQAAATEDTSSEGVLIRLEAGRGKSRAVIFSESELEIVTREMIEVR